MSDPYEITSPAKGLKNIILGIIASDNPSVWTDFSFTHGNLAESDNQIAFLDSGGIGAEPNMNLDYFSCQCLIRGSAASGSYDKAYAAISAIKDALLGIPSNPINYPDLIACNMIGHILPLGFDENRRPVLSLNFRLHVIVPLTPLSHRTEI